MTTASESPITLERRSGDSIWLLRLNRPKANIVDAAMTQALHETFVAARHCAALKAVVLSASGPHFSFGASVQEHLPSNVNPVMSLADSAYHSNEIAETALKHGAWPLHGIKKNAVFRPSPKNAYQRMVFFIKMKPRTYAVFYGKRNHSETVNSMASDRFHHRIRCRSKIGIKNEVHAKYQFHNIRMLAWMKFKKWYSV